MEPLSRSYRKKVIPPDIMLTVVRPTRDNPAAPCLGVDYCQVGKAKTEGAFMKLGAFSVSLSVSDLAASKDFYGKLGFEPIGKPLHSGVGRNGRLITKIAPSGGDVKPMRRCSRLSACELYVKRPRLPM